MWVVMILKFPPAIQFSCPCRSVVCYVPYFCQLCFDSTRAPTLRPHVCTPLRVSAKSASWGWNTFQVTVLGNIYAGTTKEEMRPLMSFGFNLKWSLSAEERSRCSAGQHWCTGPCSRASHKPRGTGLRASNMPPWVAYSHSTGVKLWYAQQSTLHAHQLLNTHPEEGLELSLCCLPRAFVVLQINVVLNSLAKIIHTRINSILCAFLPSS